MSECMKNSRSRIAVSELGTDLLIVIIRVYHHPSDNYNVMLIPEFNIWILHRFHLLF